VDATAETSRAETPRGDSGVRRGGLVAEVSAATALVVVAGLFHPIGGWAAAVLAPLAAVAAGRTGPPPWKGRATWAETARVACVAAGVSLAAVAAAQVLLGRLHFRAPVEALGAAFWCAAFAEEWFFRGYVQGRAAPTASPRDLRLFGARFGMPELLSAALFAAAHAPRLGLGAVAILAPGAVFAWARSRTGGVAAPFFLHVVFNAWGKNL